MYTFKTVLEAMNTGKPFTCTFVTCSLSRKRGGEVRTIQGAVLTEMRQMGRPLTRAERQEKDKSYTRHAIVVQLLVDGLPVEQIRKIYIPLIIKFNGEDVIPSL